MKYLEFHYIIIFIYYKIKNERKMGMHIKKKEKGLRDIG